jgi:hypothetical protein
MSATQTIPETVTLSGEAVLEAAAKLDALASYLYNVMAGGTTTGPGDVPLEVGWKLFGEAFGEIDGNPLEDVVERRSSELYDEWIAALVRGGDDA